MHAYTDTYTHHTYIKYARKQATSFADSPWPQAGGLLTSLPEVLYNALPIGISPLISNPFSIALK